VVDQLAQDYSNQPVVFVEQDIDDTVGNRVSRWWAAYNTRATLPFTMVDSGDQISEGYVSFYSIYSAMVDNALARPAAAEIAAKATRVGNKVHFEIEVTNRSGTTLSGSVNDATVHAIVYELARVQLTDRFVRDAPWISITTPLADNASAHFSLDSADLVGVDWSNIRAVVLADYRPGGSSGPYDMLQAVGVQLPLFADGFETSDTTQWSFSSP